MSLNSSHASDSFRIHRMKKHLPGNLRILAGKSFMSQSSSEASNKTTSGVPSTIIHPVHLDHQGDSDAIPDYYYESQSDQQDFQEEFSSPLSSAGDTKNEGNFHTAYPSPVTGRVETFAERDDRIDDLLFEQKIDSFSPEKPLRNQITKNNTVTKPVKSLFRPSLSSTKTPVLVIEDEFHEPIDEAEKILTPASLDRITSEIWNEEQMNAKISKQFAKLKWKRVRTVIVATLSLIVLVCVCALSCAPVLSCNTNEGFCFPQVTLQLTDRSPAASAALQTVREALKVLSYIAIDFGDTLGPMGSEMSNLNNNLDEYYQAKVIDTFSVNSIFRLNFLGYCRLSMQDTNFFCMRSYGFDLLSVLVRDTGVQLGKLTNTNVDIMGDSFAVIYEYAISGFNQLVNRDKDNDGYSHIDYAILLQKFSKGVAFLSVVQFIVNCLLLLMGSCLFVVICFAPVKFFTGFQSEVMNSGDDEDLREKKSKEKNEEDDTINKEMFVKQRTPNKQVYGAKKWLIILMTLFGFISLLINFLICTLTHEYASRLVQLADSAGIATAVFDSGYKMIWCCLAGQILECVLIVYLANSFRKKLL